MIVCPTPDAWGQGSDECGLVAPTMGSDERFHLFQVTLLGFFTRFDDDLVPPFTVMLSHRKLPDCEAKKVKPYATFVFVRSAALRDDMKCMCDVGLAGFQGQSYFGQPYFSQRSSGLQGLEIFIENGEIVCKANNRYSVFLGERCSNGGFEPCKATFANKGETIPPCGVPASDEKIFPFSKMPAFSQPRTCRSTILAFRWMEKSPGMSRLNSPATSPRTWRTWSRPLIRRPRIPSPQT